jgi:2-polyprenyl-3-methyl-5-hydroxy-6-metoxy-1,4-benzoquinol methylase
MIKNSINNNFRGEDLESLINYRTINHTQCIACDSSRHSYWARSGSYKAVKCDECGLVWMNPQLNEEGLKKYYTDYLGRRRINNDKKMLQRSVQYKSDVEFIERYINFGKVLDVGCSGGFFLQNFSQNFEKFGIEIDPEAVNYANEITFADGGANIQCGTIDNLPNTIADIYNDFDLIVMRGSIEHVPDPILSINKVADMLKKEGVFYITATQNVESFSADLYREQWTLFHPVQHLWHFSPHTLQLVCEKFGLQLISTIFPYLGTPYEDVEENILRVAEDIKKEPSERGVSPPFFENMMSLVFRKI